MQPSTPSCLRAPRAARGNRTSRPASAPRRRDSALPRATTVTFEPYLPMFDPDEFHDPSFFVELEKMGYRQILVGGTGSARLPELVASVRRETRLSVVLYPGGPAAVTQADLVVLPDVMNSHSQFARPFGSNSVATAMGVAKLGVPFAPVAYFILGNSTAKWFYDAQLPPSDKVLLATIAYAQMVGYRHIALDYEDPALALPAHLVPALRKAAGDAQLIVSDEFDAQTGREALRAGIDTVITPSNLYEQARDPLALAAEMRHALLPHM